MDVGWPTMGSDLVVTESLSTLGHHCFAVRWTAAYGLMKEDFDWMGATSRDQLRMDLTRTHIEHWQRRKDGGRSRGGNILGVHTGSNGVDRSSAASRLFFHLDGKIQRLHVERK